jgi:hypothetical protein
MTNRQRAVSVAEPSPRQRPFSVHGKAMDHVRGPVYLGANPGDSRCPACKGIFARPFYPSGDIDVQFLLHGRKDHRDCRLLIIVYPEGRVTASVVPDFIKDRDIVEFARLRLARSDP